MAKVYLDAGDAFTVSNNNVVVYGSSGDEAITVASGVTGVTFDQNAERVVFAGASSSFTYKQAGNTLQVYSGGVLVATVPLQGDTDGTQLTFTDGTVDTVLDTTTGEMTLGGATVSDTTAGAVTPTTIDTSVVSTGGSGGSGGTIGGVTYTLAADATSVTEGSSVTFTVTASAAPSADNDTTLSYQIVGVTQGVAGPTASGDFTALTGSVTIPAGETSATFTVSPLSDSTAEGYEAFKVQLLDTSFNAAATSGNIVVEDLVVDGGGQTYTLTASADTGASFTGTAGNDTYVGQISADMGTGTTINAGDALNGAGGTDTLNISVAGASTAAVSSTATTLTDIEKVLVSNFDSNANDAHDTTFDASLWTGATTVGLSSSAATGDTEFSNLKNIVAAEMSSGAADLTVGYQSSVVSGTADSQTLTVNGVTAGTFVADSGIETLAITASTTKSTLTGITAAGASKLTIDGGAALTIGSEIGTTMETIDASTATGALSLILGTADLTVTGGTGNDTIRLDGAQIDTNDTINAGDGTDTLLLTGAVSSSTNGAQLAGFEKLLSYQNVVAAGAFSQNVSYVSGVSEVGVSKMTYTDDEDDTDDDVTVSAAFTNMSATQTGVISGVSTATDDDDNNNDLGDLTANVTFSLASDTTADSGTITLGTSSASATSAATNQDITLNVAASDYETLALVSQGGANTIGTLTAADATTLNITASKALTITTLTAANLATIDASASTADVAAGATSKASTITGGSGNDTFTGSTAADSISGGAGKDTLDGGTGNDTIYGGAGNDSITGGAGNDELYGEDGDDIFTDAATGENSIDGGAGNDTFTVATYSALTSADTLIGGDGTDTLAIGDAASVNLTTDITQLSNVSGIEVIGFTGLNGSDTITVNDGVVSTAGGALTLKFLTGVTGANTIDASGVLASASTVNFTDLTGLGTSYSIGNGTDNISMGDGADTVTVSNNAYLSANDTLAGGSGSDNLLFTNTTGQTISATQLTNVTGFETFTITTGGAGNYVFTLTDAIVGAQQAVGGTFTVTHTVTDTGTTKIDGSAVTSSYDLALTGAAGDDTLIGGSGNDSFDLQAGGDDSVTGGAGNDTFLLDDAENTGAVITDIDFGTSSTSVDILSFANINSGITLAAANLDTWANADGNTNVVIMNNQTYANDTDLETALAGHATLAGKVFVFWQDSFSNVHVGYDAAADVDAGSGAGLLDLATLTGVTLTGLVSNLDVADLAV